LPSLSVAENVTLGVEPMKNGLFDYSTAVKRTQEIADKYNFKVDATAKVSTLSVGQMQKVEILKALIKGAKILILDEPTAVLTPQETEELFEQLFKLRDSGVSVIFISHKLDEIKRICNRATIMRNGRSMGTYEVADISTQEMSRLMVGREVSLKFDKNEQKLTKDVFLKVRNLSVNNSQGVLKVDDLSFDLKGGEILGIAGVEGNGQTELINTLTGINKQYRGHVSIKGQDIANASIKDIREMNQNELNQKLASLKEELFNLRFQLATGQLENPMRIKEVKKTIARIKTIQREQELQA
jgi:simple sugar transport system ATP-binding protein